MDYKDEMLKKAGAYELMCTTEGWKHIEEYISSKIADFTNVAIMEGFKDMNEYGLRRGEVVGLQNLLIEVTNTLKNLNNFRNEQSKPSTEE